MRTKPEQSEKYALEIFSSDAYLVVNKKLLQHYGPDTAIFLSNLLDKYKYFLDHEMIKDGWFFLVHDQQILDTGLNLGRIRNCKKQLKEDDILQTKMKGQPAKEWYKLELTPLLSLLPNRARPTDLDRARPTDLDRAYKDNKLKDNKEKIEYIFLPLAQQLSLIVQSYKNIHHDLPLKKQWAEDIRKLSEINEIKPKRIKRVLDWYEDNRGGQYIPIVESGASLREKFIRLEAAMEREQNPYPEKDRPRPNTNGYIEPGKVYREADRHVK
jgi:hypothetical protein